ncbi:hypothetical protein Tco_1331085 [Tanacetum coccineum]
MLSVVRRSLKKETSTLGEIVSLNYIKSNKNWDNKALEIDSLKRRVKKLEKKKGSRTHRLRRLYKVGRSARVVSSNDEEVTLVDETHGRYGDNLMFDTGVLDNEQDMAEKEVDMAEKDVSTADPVTTAGEVVTTANVVVSTAEVTTNSTTTTTLPSQPSQLPQTKDKGKEKMVEPKKPLKKKDQIMFDKEVAQKIQAQLQAELEEEGGLQDKKKEDANIVEWDNVQAMIDADYKLAARL